MFSDYIIDNMRKYLVLLLLSGCAPYMVHQPDLTIVPANENKYSDDLNTCRHQVFDKNGIDIGRSAAIAGFGMPGMLAMGENPAFKQVDDCLRAKGYAIH